MALRAKILITNNQKRTKIDLLRKGIKKDATYLVIFKRYVATFQLLFYFFYLQNNLPTTALIAFSFCSMAT